MRAILFAALLFLPSLGCATLGTREPEAIPTETRERAQRATDARRTDAVLEVLGGLVLTGLGALSTYEALAPCPPQQDCSLNGLGLVFGLPLDAAGVFVIATSGRDFNAASKMQDRIDDGRFDLVRAQESASVLSFNGLSEIVAGSAAILGAGALTAVCLNESRCADETFTVGVGAADVLPGRSAHRDGSPDEAERFALR
jgi:hypothetical protein